MTTDKKQHGGKRSGAGRKPTGKEPTVIIRVPASLAERIKQGELKQEPQQTWAFSYEDLQEQAKLLERLQRENEQLKAELQLKTKEVDRVAMARQVDLSTVDKIQLLELLKQLESRERPTVFRTGEKRSCECLNTKGQLCKNVADDVLVQELRLNVCKTHYQKYKHLE